MSGTEALELDAANRKQEEISGFRAQALTPLLLKCFFFPQECSAPAKSADSEVCFLMNSAIALSVLAGTDRPFPIKQWVENGISALPFHGKRF